MTRLAHWKFSNFSQIEIEIWNFHLVRLASWISPLICTIFSYSLSCCTSADDKESPQRTQSIRPTFAKEDEISEDEFERKFHSFNVIVRSSTTLNGKAQQKKIIKNRKKKTRKTASGKTRDEEIFLPKKMFIRSTHEGNDDDWRWLVSCGTAEQRPVNHRQ